VISFALHRDFTLTDRSAQKGVLAAPDRASFSDVADCGFGVTLSLTLRTRRAYPPSLRSTRDCKAIFQVMRRIDQLNLNGRKEHIEQEKLP